MERKKLLTIPGLICPILLLVIVFLGTNAAQAFTPGKTYDSENWQEIKGLVPPFVLEWVRKGEFILTTGKLNFEFKLEKDFLETSQENLGKFDINEKGLLVDKKTGEQPKFVYGLPFPRINPKDPGAGEKIMGNFKYGRMRLGGDISPWVAMSIGKDRLERELIGIDNFLFYQGRPGGPIENPDNFLRQCLTYYVEPMEFRGTVEMVCRYNDERPDVTFTYVPSLRKVKRTSSASRSDAAMGLDMCMDDGSLWSGKNATFSWRLIGEGKVLSGFTTPDPIRIKEGPDGTVNRVAPPMKIGFEDPNWKGAPWAPVNLTWSPRPVWIIEGMPEDPVYNFGRHVFYVDKDTFVIWFKEVYDRSDKYWKGMFLATSFQVAPSGKTNLLKPDAYVAVDDKTHHATYIKNIDTYAGFTDTMYVPLSLLGPGNYNMSVLRQWTK